MKSYIPDQDVLRAVVKHKSIVDELAGAYLWKIPQYYVGKLSSKGVRLRQTTCGAHLLSAVRRAMLADAAFYPVGPTPLGSCFDFLFSGRRHPEVI